ncbi:MAG: PAS domain S-box protein, partial [Acidobacteria bacterium]|nr:PAS domain S-box protein [Acidobacteriota bacterium]
MDSEGSETILTVNDAPDQLELLGVILGKAGYRTLAAGDGGEALALAARHRPALVVSDVQMPEMDGIELTRSLRADPRLRHTPLLLLSAHRRDTASVVAGLAAGADEYLEIPYDPLRLVALVARLLERARVEAHYRGLVEQAPDIIYTFDTGGRLTSVNNAGLIFFGLAGREAVGRHVGRLLKLDDPEAAVRAAVERLRSAGARREQVRARDAAGEARWLELDQALICDRAGNPTGVRGVARDVTGHKEIEERLRRSEEQYRALFDRANDLIYTVDMDGRYTSVNRAAEKLTGYAREEAAGMTWAQLVAPEYHDLTRRMIARKLAGEEEVTCYEVEIVTKDGRRVPVEINSGLIHDAEGRPAGMQGIARDVTWRKRAEADIQARAEQEAETEKMRSLGQLSAGVAHNFNNALTAILGRTQLLLRQATDERQRRSLKVIEIAALDAAEIVRRVQTFARRAPAAGFDPVPLSRLLADTVQLTRTRWEDDARAAGVRYDVSFTNDAGAGDTVFASASELREVFVNLIFNAVEAMPGGGRLTLRERAEGDWLVVEVADTGAGVAEELRERVFEPFFTTKGPQGSGLGLAVSYGIVKRHGGTIEAAGAPEGGTVFTVRLPRRARAAAPREGAHAEAPAAALVLVVDDDPEVRDVLADLLRELGHEAVAVGGGATALELLARRDFDLLVTDLAMPEMDGLTLAARVRALAPATRVVLSTGYDQSAPAEALRAGVNVRVISASWGGTFYSRALQDAIARAGAEGIIFIAAAG